MLIAYAREDESIPAMRDIPDRRAAVILARLYRAGCWVETITETTETQREDESR